MKKLTKYMKQKLQMIKGVPSGETIVILGGIILILLILNFLAFHDFSGNENETVINDNLTSNNISNLSAPEVDANSITGDVVFDYNDSENEEVNESDGTSSDFLPSVLTQALFESGRGVYNYNKMDYVDYESAIYFTPYYDMIINTIEPDVYLCLDECYYSVEIYDEAGNILGRGDNVGSKPAHFDGRLSEDIQLRGGKKYRIVQHVWGNKTIGIFTAGIGNKRANNGEYMVIYGKALYYEAHNNRGPVAFKIRGVLNDVTKYESASWVCKQVGFTKRREINTYEINDFKKNTECKTKEDWLGIASSVCTSFCKEESPCNYEVKALIFGELC